MIAENKEVLTDNQNTTNTQDNSINNSAYIDVEDVDYDGLINEEESNEAQIRPDVTSPSTKSDILTNT